MSNEYPPEVVALIRYLVDSKENKHEKPEVRCFASKTLQYWDRIRRGRTLL
jgi:hypothetical protein